MKWDMKLEMREKEGRKRQCDVWVREEKEKGRRESEEEFLLKVKTCLLHLCLTRGVISSRGGIVNEDKQKKIKTSSLIYAWRSIINNK